MLANLHAYLKKTFSGLYDCAISDVILPVNFDINIPSLFIEGLQIKLVKLIGNYNLVNKKMGY